MINIGILSDDSGHEIAGFIENFLKNSIIRYKITENLRNVAMALDRKTGFDIIIVNFLRECDDIIFKEKVSCENFVLNSDVISNNSSAMILSRPPLTFGLNPKACVTASSLGSDSITCCIQRSFFTIFNEQVCQQEIVINIGCDESAAVSLLAATACGLLCGISPKNMRL